MSPRALYRLRQFCRAVAARPSDADLAAARAVLTEAQLAIFLTMAPRDQWHSIETLRLLRGNLSDPDAELAALLHDAGKGYVLLHERVVYVLLSTFPALLARLAAPNRGRLRSALYRSLHHAEVGADLAMEAGASARAVQIIRGHHHTDASDTIALALASADDHA